MTTEVRKRNAAEASLAFVEPGMVLGLGTGSTAAHMIEMLGAKVRRGLAVTAVPTSAATARLAIEHGVPLVDLERVERLDLTIDGADEIDPALNLIKGGGGALLREKIVAQLSRRMIVIADAAKRVPQLGAFPLPVEVIPFAAVALVARLTALGCTAALRLADGARMVTDEGNNIIDCAFDRIDRPAELAATLSAIAGVVEHGLFLGTAERALIGTDIGVDEIVGGVDEIVGGVDEIVGGVDGVAAERAP